MSLTGIALNKGAAVHEPDLLPVLDGGGVGGEQPQVPAADPALQGRPRHRTLRLHPNRGRQALPGIPWYTFIKFIRFLDFTLQSFNV
jgi:hypothetical protein